MRVLVLCVFFSVASVPVFAQYTHTWTGAAQDGEWGNAANWNPQTVPDASSQVYVSTQDRVILFSDVSLASFTMEEGILQLHGFTLKTTGLHVTGIQVDSYGDTIETAFQT